MIRSKPWYASKIVWVGILQFVYGAADMVAQFIEGANFTPTSIAALVTGLLTIVFRIWFTEHQLEV